MERGGGAPLTPSPVRAGRRRAVRFAPEHAPAVRAFNQRLARAGAPWRFPETSVPDWLPRADGVPVWQEYFLLLEDGAVRGAYVLKRQDAAVGRGSRSEEHTSELQSPMYLVCRLLLEKKKTKDNQITKTR